MSDKRRLRHAVFGIGLLAGIAIPVAVLVLLARTPPQRVLPVPPSGGSTFDLSQLPVTQVRMGSETDTPPWITNAQIVDWNGDGVLDVLVCDARRHRVVGFSRDGEGAWQEHVLATDLPAPAHATVIDFENDGDLDLLVSLLGRLWPEDEAIGSLVLLEKTANGYERHQLLTDVRRVADAQPADFDADGDLDIAVAVFGYARGAILWLENHGDWRFEQHTLLDGAGAIHVLPADFDGDGDLDLVSQLTQDDEEVHGFENVGGGAFKRHRLFASLNFDLGGAGLVLDDLDQDGDFDLLLPVGDNLEDSYSYPQPYHGAFWLENRGNWEFITHRIAHFGGTYAAAAGDLDGDGDRDVVLVSLTNDWDTPDRASVVWLENNGKQEFTPWQLASQPTHLVTVACGDLNSDGRDDVLTGCLNLMPPYTPSSGIVAWMSKPGKEHP